jgi:hypothetical protein
MQSATNQVHIFHGKILKEIDILNNFKLQERDFWVDNRVTILRSGE